MYKLSITMGLLSYFILLAANADVVSVVVTDKTTGKIIAGDSGESVSQKSLQEKMWIKNRTLINPAKHDVLIINETQARASRKSAIESFNLGHAKKDQYLKEIIKEYLRKNKIDPGK